MASDGNDDHRPPEPDESASPESDPPSAPSEPTDTSPDMTAEDAGPSAAPLGLSGVPRVVSLIVLLAVVLLIGVLFFRVMASFVVPLFLAAVLAVVFKPLHLWSRRVTHERAHLSAFLSTSLVSLLVLGPTVLVGWRAYVETSRLVRVVLADDSDAIAALDDAEAILAAPPRQASDPAPPPAPDGAATTTGGGEGESPTGSPTNEADEPTAESSGWYATLRGQADGWLTWYRENVNADFDPRAAAESVGRYAAQQAVRFGLVGVQALVGFTVGLVIMVIALYYFFADGPGILETLMRLSPLDDRYERELFVQFTSVSRAVVVATLLSAIVQGVLAGFGYYFAMDAGSPIFLLTVLTTVLAIVPFVGATAVWVPVALWVFFVQEEGVVPGVVLALYGAGIVSTIDNFLKPYILHGRSNLHPLLALLSVLGGLQLLGPIGLLVGPMLVAFLQALLGMLRTELERFQAGEPEATA